VNNSNHFNMLFKRAEVPGTPFWRVKKVCLYDSVRITTTPDPKSGKEFVCTAL